VPIPGIQSTMQPCQFPYLCDIHVAELPLQFTWGQGPCVCRAGSVTRLQVQTAAGWQDCPERRFTPQGVLAVEAEVAL